MKHQVTPSPPVADAADSRRIVLKDGSVATVRGATSADVPAMRQFFLNLSPDSRYRRFFTAGEPPDALIRSLSDSTDPARNLTLIAERSVDSHVRIIAAASYTTVTDEAAEAAFAVADQFQGKGLGTALLERLALAAAEAGFRRFQATTLENNAPMLEVFRDSGFEIHSKSSGGSVDVQLSLAPSAATVSAEERRHRLATAASLRPLLEPAAMAVVGASRDPSSIGRRVLDAVLAAGFKGKVYAVNPRAAEVAGLATYASARDLPAGVDLAVVAVPAPAVLAVVDECAAAGVKSLVVITAGFAEAGPEGRALQDELTERVRNHGMRMVGPNCMGLLNANAGVRLNASFSPIMPAAGHLGLMSQSGALGIAIIQLATVRQLGLSTFVSAGNKADVSGNDLLEYWQDDPSTRVILLYLESFGNPRRFARLARRVARQKPIVAVKSGRTRSGSLAASSHTAALATSDVTVDALFHQSGVIRADTLDEMFDIAACLDMQPLPRGRRVAVLTNAGGPGILAADACEAAGLTLPELSGGTRTRVIAALPAMASCRNPVDMIASAGPVEYERTIEALLAAPEIDALLIIFTPVEVGRTPQVLQAICRGVAAGRRAIGSSKPVLTCILADAGYAVPLETGGERIPAFLFPENAARALGKIATYAEWRAQPPALFWGFDDIRVDDARTVCREAVAARGDTWLTDDETRRLLEAFALPVVPGGVAKTADEAASIANAIGFPVAAKISAAQMTHKTDIGGVKLNLADASAVRQAFDDIVGAARRTLPAETILGVQIETMVGGGVETMMGIAQDPLFGPVVAFGLGGIHVEVLGDVRFRVAPLTDRDADELLHGVRGFRLLQGYRGHPAADVEALRDVLLRLSRLADGLPEIAELDLNPVIALPPGSGCRIVDARIRVKAARRTF